MWGRLHGELGKDDERDLANPETDGSVRGALPLAWGSSDRGRRSHGGARNLARAPRVCRSDPSRSLRPIWSPPRRYFCISYGVPENRLSYLENEEYKWKVTVHTVPKPTVSAAAAPEAKEGSNMHYIYVCQKGLDQGRRAKE